MEYSKIDKLNVNPSLLGFGCMRFPKKEDGTIDEVEAERMLDHAIESGVTYIDTAYPYHDGESEPFIGRVLKKYKREDFYLATKLPMSKINSLEQAKEIFEDCNEYEVRVLVDVLKATKTSMRTVKMFEIKLNENR